MAQISGRWPPDGALNVILWPHLNPSSPPGQHTPLVHPPTPLSPSLLAELPLRQLVWLAQEQPSASTLGLMLLQECRLGVPH